MPASIPSSLPRLRPGHVAPADVLLYHGTEPFACAIQCFDDSLYYHAALALASDRVVEAVMVGGIGSRPLAATFERRPWALVRRYRAELLLDPAAPRTLAPVVVCARDVARDRQRYAREQLVPLALLLLTRSLPRTRSFGRMAVGVLRAAAAQLERLAVADGAHRHRPLVCSGLVAYCFAEALPRGTYALLFVRPERLRSRRAVHADSLLADVMVDIERQSERPGRRGSRSVASAEIHTLDELEALVTAYLDELEQPEAHALRGADPGIDLEDVEDAVRLFAACWHSAMGHEPSATLRGAAGDGAAAALDALVELAEELVTPGDLARSPTLMDVGTLCPSRKATLGRSVVRRANASAAARSSARTRTR